MKSKQKSPQCTTLHFTSLHRTSLHITEGVAAAMGSLGSYLLQISAVAQKMALHQVARLQRGSWPGEIARGFGILYPWTNMLNKDALNLYSNIFSEESLMENILSQSSFTSRIIFVFQLITKSSGTWQMNILTNYLRKLYCNVQMDCNLLWSIKGKWGSRSVAVTLEPIVGQH